MTIANKITEVGYREFESKEGMAQLNLAVDCGSTQTRTAIINTAGKVNGDSALEMDSRYGIVNTDTNTVVSKSETIYDNLDFILRDITDSNIKPVKVIEELHIMKGELLDQVDIPVERLDQSKPKSTQEFTFINTLANIGIRNLINIFETGVSYSDVKLDLTIGLTAFDTRSTNRLINFEKKLAGVYEIEYPRYGIKTRFHIDENNVYELDEGSAVARYWSTTRGENLNSYKRIIVCDGGGRSFDYAFIADGTIKSKGSASTQYGGNRFVNSIVDTVLQNHDVDTVTPEMIMEALDTGLLPVGNEFIDIAEDISKVKKEYAIRVIDDLDTVCSRVDTTATQLNLIITAGRAFKSSRREMPVPNANERIEMKTVSPSLSAFVSKAFKKKNSSIRVENISDKFALVWGLVFYRITNPVKLGREGVQKEVAVTLEK